MIQSVKEQVNILDVANTYGIKLNSRNKALCPFHNEKSPSFSISADKQLFHCFGCGAGGDVVSLVERLFNLSPLEAARKLNDDFRLGYDSGELSKEQKYELSEQIRQRDENQKALTAFQKWEQQYFVFLCDNIRLLDELMKVAKPKDINNVVFTDEYVFAVNKKQLFEYHLSILYDGQLDDKISLFAEVNGRWNNERSGNTRTDRQTQIRHCG